MHPLMLDPLVLEYCLPWWAPMQKGDSFFGRSNSGNRVFVPGCYGEWPHAAADARLRGSRVWLNQAASLSRASPGPTGAMHHPCGTGRSSGSRRRGLKPCATHSPTRAAAHAASLPGGSSVQARQTRPRSAPAANSPGRDTRHTVALSSLPGCHPAGWS